MRVERLELENFRGIHKLSLSFPTPVTVLAGINGSGKTTILQALATLLWRLGHALHEGVRERQPLQAADVRNGTQTALLLIETSGRFDWLPEAVDRRDGSNGTRNGARSEAGDQRKVSWGLRVERTLTRVKRSLSNVWQRPQAEYLGFVARLLKEHLQDEPSAPVPFAAFYRTNRAVLDIPLRIRKKHSFDQLSVFDDALDGGWSSFRLFFEWFREREDLENQERARSKKFVDLHLQAVRDAIAALMPGFTDLRVQRHALRMTVEKEGVELDVGQLSDGEKCLLAMAADIARRLALANPAEKSPRHAEAIVLIDEIELHLHPLWQRRVLPNLRATFPNCQFIVSTHSPQVLSSVRPEEICLLRSDLDGVVVEHPASSFGRNSNQILIDLMGTPDRPQEIRDELDQMFAAIDRGDVKDARRREGRLAEKIGADEPELTRADIMLRMREGAR